MAPLVVLLGWGGSSSRQLEPYRRLWRRRGVEARTFVANPFVGTFAPGPEVRRVWREARAIARTGAGRDVWVHAFSDNGYITWGVMLEELRALPEGVALLERVRGVVFDSTPGLHHGHRMGEFAFRMSRGMTPALLSLLGREEQSEHPWITPALEAVLAGWYVLRGRGASGMACEVERMYTNVLRWEPGAPQLYLHGEHDPIAPPASIEEHVARERARGIDARAVHFPGAPHVGCWPSAPDVYEDALEAFVARAG